MTPDYTHDRIGDRLTNRNLTEAERLLAQDDCVRFAWILGKALPLWPKQVIDIGASDGTISHEIQHRLGTDTAIFAIEPHQAHRDALAGRRAWVYHGDGISGLWALGSIRGAIRRSFDLALCCEVLEHMDAVTGDELLRAIHFNARKVIVTVPNALCQSYLESGRARRDWPDHVRYFTPNALGDTLHKFQDVVIEPIVGTLEDSIWLGATCRTV
jgi:hypothetical protein